MRKIDEIYKFINENSERDKDTIIKKALKKFNVSQASAQAYYYMWKKEFMKGANCVPKKLKTNLQSKQGIPVETKKEKLKEEAIEVINDDLKVKKGTIVKGKYGIYIKEKNQVTSGEVIFKTAEDIEEYRKKEITLFYKRLSEIMDVMKLEV